MDDSFGIMGLLLTMVTIFFTLWQSELEKYLNIDVGINRRNKKIIKEVKNLYVRFKILTYGVLVIVLSILPDIIKIINKTIILFSSIGMGISKHYKSIYPMYLMLWIFSFILLIYLYYKNKQLKNKIKKLEEI